MIEGRVPSRPARDPRQRAGGDEISTRRFAHPERQLSAEDPPPSGGEIGAFVQLVVGDEVTFLSASYSAGGWTPPCPLSI